MLEYPGAVFPVSKVDQTIDTEEADYVPRNSQDKFNWELYKRERYVDAPVSLQVVGYVGYGSLRGNSFSFC